jgi:hypothetical protein
MTMLVAKPSVVGSTIMTRNAFGHEASLPDASFSTLFDFSGRVLATARGAQPPADCTCGTCGVCVAAGGGWVSPRDNSQQRASPRRPPRPSLLRSTRSAEHLGRRQYEFDAFDVKSETASSLVASLGAAAATPPPGAKLTDGEWVWMTSEGACVALAECPVPPHRFLPTLHSSLRLSPAILNPDAPGRGVPAGLEHPGPRVTGRAGVEQCGVSGLRCTMCTHATQPG